MAERDYKRGEGITPIQEMSTRQLRRYIRERVEEAQQRIESIQNDPKLDLTEVSEAFQEQLTYVQSFGSGRGGSIKKDTSRMTKEEMAMYAYAVRDLNMLDTESKYARNIDYKENKDRYNAFVMKMALNNLNKESRDYWAQFITPKGNVSKRGYEQYKNYVNFLRSIDETIATYGYESIKDIYYDQGNQKRKDLVESLLYNTFKENKGKGKTPSELLDIVNDELSKYDVQGNRLPEKMEEEKEIDFTTKRQEKRASKKKGSSGSKRSSGSKESSGSKKASSAKKIPKVKKTSAKSKQNIKTSTGRKMKNGTVREKQGTQKL